MLNICEATEQDVSDILQIAEKTWWPTYSHFLSAEQIRYMLDTIYSGETMKKEIAKGSETFLLLKDERGGPLAFASYAVRPEDPAVYKLHKLYVLPEHHGKGLGRSLIGEITARLQKKGVHILDLNVNRLNPARLFYEKTGFKIIREEDIPIGAFWMNDYVMRLQF
jgi:GNAT superfamily N-acetyltransferase